MFAEIRRQDGFERSVFVNAGEQTRIHAIGGSGGPNLPRVISDITLDVARILCDQLHVAGFHIQPKRVEYLRIALVHPEQNLVLGNIL